MTAKPAPHPALVLASEAALLEIVDGFRTRSLPEPRRTHQAHLVVGLRHVLNLPAEAAFDALRHDIAACNEAVGTANTDSEGHHETIMRFYAWAIRKFAAEAGTGAGAGPEAGAGGATLLGLANALLAGRCAAKLFPFEYCRRGRPLSVARAPAPGRSRTSSRSTERRA